MVHRFEAAACSCYRDKRTGRRGGRFPPSSRGPLPACASRGFLAFTSVLLLTLFSSLLFPLVPSLNPLFPPSLGVSPPERTVPHPTNRSLLLRVDRGGDVTFHGPGQLTVYPIIDLDSSGGLLWRKDLHLYLRLVEDVVIDVLKSYGVAGRRDERGTGVWVSGGKVAAVGVGCSSWITKHGFAINCTRECLPFFEQIVPCGIKKDVGGVTCLQDVVGHRVETKEVGRRVVESFAKIFDCDVN